MFSSVFRSVWLAAVIVVAYGAVDIKKYLKVCDRNSVDVNDCMAEAVQQGIETLTGGIPDLGVPSVDPYHQKELRVDYKNNQINAKLHLTDIYVEGLKGATVHDARVRADDDRLHIEIDLTAPQIHIRGDYEGVGSYNALNLKASGGFNTTLSDLIWTWKLDGTAQKKGDETYMRINSVYMRPDVGNMVSQLSNNNVDSRDLTSIGAGFLNENWRVLYRELLPFAQSNWNRTGVRVANKIFLKVPYNEILPNNS